MYLYVFMYVCDQQYEYDRCSVQYVTRNVT